MRIPLARMIAKSRPRKRRYVLRPVVVPSTLATDLFNSGYSAVVAAWADLIPTLTATYERTLAEMQTDAPADATADISAVERRIAAAMLTIRVRLERWAKSVEVLHRKKWRAAVLTATGVDLDTMLGSQTARMSLEAVIERNMALVSSVSDQARTRMADAVFRGFRARKSAADIARELRAAVEMSRARALRIAAHQTRALASELDQERRREAGIDQWKWIHSGKVHFRPEHKARDGNIYTDEDAPEDTPGELPGCGCTSAAVLDIDAMIERELAAA
jgi:SPP1 gp7 family putative phage head morphogenesis protein